MTQNMRWWIALALALSMVAGAGCATKGATDTQDKQWDRPPGWVPFSA